MNSKPCNSVMRVFKVKRHRDHTHPETLTEEHGTNFHSKKKKKKKSTTPESLANELDSMSLTQRSAMRTRKSKRVLNRIATMQKLNERDEMRIMTQLLKSNMAKKRRHKSKRSLKRLGLESKISKLTQRNRQGMKSKPGRKKTNQRKSNKKELIPEKSERTVGEQYMSENPEQPSFKELMLEIYRSETDEKERRRWRRTYAWLRDEDSNENSDLETDETSESNEGNEIEDDDEYVYDYYIDGKQYLHATLPSDWQIVEFDGDEIYPECELHPANEYPEDESDSVKDYFTSTDEDNDEDDMLCV
eukprot:g8130.t1